MLPVREPGPFRKGFGLGAGAGAGLGVALAVIGLVTSLLSSLALVGLGALTSSQNPTMNTIWGSPSATKTLRAININGTILTDSTGGSVLGGGIYGYEVARVIDSFTAKDNSGLVLRVNTPGGTITGAKSIADAITRFQQRTGHKVFVHVEGMSASGGVYATAGADEIIADHGSLVGSIGVIIGPFERYRNVTATDGGILGGGVTTQGGIDQFYVTAGRDKDFGNPYRDMSPGERDVLQRGVDNAYSDFVDHVANSRGIPANAIRDDLGAHIFDNKVAQEKKLIDGTMGIDEAFTHFATSAGLDPADTKVVAPNQPSFLDSLLSSETRLPGQALPVVPQQGVRPVTAAAVCGPGVTVLAYHGDPTSVCR